MSDDIQDWLERDKERLQNMNTGGREWGVAGYLEAGLASITALIALAWLLSMWWVPDPIDGTTWMGLGMLGMALFGLPTVAIYWLRRGGTVVVREILAGVVP